jgi:hypothetical protein
MAATLHVEATDYREALGVLVDATQSPRPSHGGRRRGLRATSAHPDIASSSHAPIARVCSVDARWTHGNVLLGILVALVAAAIFLSGWSLWQIVLALAVIVVVIAFFYALSRRNGSRER